MAVREEQPRVPAGVREGGRYSTVGRREPDLRLGNVTRELHHGLIELSPATLRVIAALEQAGGSAYVVGGSVRDALLGSDPKDVDLEVYGLDPERLKEALRGVGRVDEVGKSFQVLTVATGGERLDVALPRTERRTGPGHRDFEVSVDPYADLPTATARRDYTVNALLWDPRTHEVVDCWGGLEDLRNGVLRHTTQAFAEDPLRVLRGARFAAKLGMRMDPETIALARELSEEFDSLSKDRVWKEWSAMATTARRPSAWLEVLEDTDWLRHFPQVSRLRNVPQDPAWHPEGDVLEHSRQAADVAAARAESAGMGPQEREIVVLAAMFHDVGKSTNTQHNDDGSITSHGHDKAGAQQVTQMLREMGAPKDVVAHVAPLVREHMTATSAGGAPTKAAVRRLARRLAPATIEMWAVVLEADHGGRGSASRSGASAPWLELAAQMGAQRAPVPRLLTGRDLIAVGMSPSPRFASLLAAATTAQDDGQFTDRDGALAWLAEHQHDDWPESRRR